MKLPGGITSTCELCGLQTWARIPTRRCDTCTHTPRVARPHRGTGPPTRRAHELDENLSPIPESILEEIVAAGEELADTLEGTTDLTDAPTPPRSQHWPQWRNY